MALVKFIATHALTKIADDPQAINRVLNSLNSSMPELESPAMDREIFWHTISNVEGWRLQENLIFGNCRILDPQDCRKVWSGKRAILKAFEQL
ncbi:MAG: hypothetical protein AAFO95_01350 [Cyanobacteria bacterium J06600_6]